MNHVDRTRRLAPWLAGLAVGLVLIACSGIGPPREPTRVPPTAIPTPSQNAAVTFGEDPDDVEEALALEIQDAIDEARYFTGADCQGLAGVLKEDPQLVSRMRGYAEVLRATTRRDQVGGRSSVQELLDRLDSALSELDQKLAGCGLARS